jgi:hypothetical protein
VAWGGTLHLWKAEFAGLGRDHVLVRHSYRLMPIAAVTRLECILSCELDSEGAPWTIASDASERGPFAARDGRASALSRSTATLFSPWFSHDPVES